MPELPEVETVVRDIRPVVHKKKITSVEVSKLSLRRKWDSQWNDVLHGRRIHDVWRRGKWIILLLDDDMHLLLHLGMTGQLTVVSSKTPREPHTHLILGLDRGGKELRFRDIRRFGSASLFFSRDELEAFFQKSRLGPEPFDVPLDYLRKKICGTRRCLKAVLLDQQVIAGVGNIYADEALFVARLHPRTLGCETTPAEVRRLRDAVEFVLKRAIKYRGSSIRNYVGGSGLKGKYQEEFMVYGRKGEPCPRCKSKIERIRLAGRATHYCPKCQKIKRKTEK